MLQSFSGTEKKRYEISCSVYLLKLSAFLADYPRSITENQYFYFQNCNFVMEKSIHNILTMILTDLLFELWIFQIQGRKYSLRKETTVNTQMFFSSSFFGQISYTICFYSLAPHPLLQSPLNIGKKGGNVYTLNLEI